MHTTADHTAVLATPDTALETSVVWVSEHDTTFPKWETYHSDSLPEGIVQPCPCLVADIG